MNYINFSKKLLFQHAYSNNRSSKNLIRFVSALVRASADFNENITKRIENKEMKARKHPGIMPHGPFILPEYIKTAIERLLEEGPRQQLLRESKEFNNYLLSRQLPTERSNFNETKSLVQDEVESSLGVDTTKLSEEELTEYDELKKVKVNSLLKQRIYNWKHLDFTNYLGLLYLVTRSVAEYNVITQIFKEIYARTSFKPKTIFDFGSGVGSAIWAANNVWGKYINEYYCVDSSASMITISETIFKDQHFCKRVFHRQFLPSSNEVSSDLVISAYSLLELPSASARLETITNLWRKTKRFLVLIENGNSSGFKVINEARDFLLSKEVNKDEEAHIFAPCPHTLSCPRTSTKNNCSFSASYSCFPQKPETLKTEFFSYIVFEKDITDTADRSWPRLVQPVLCRSKHVVCRFCTPSGNLQEVIFTPTKHGKIAYKCAKATRWGDLFPCSLKPNESKRNAKEKQHKLEEPIHSCEEKGR